jgi:hypothetical protein
MRLLLGGFFCTLAACVPAQLPPIPYGSAAFGAYVRDSMIKFTPAGRSPMPVQNFYQAMNDKAKNKGFPTWERRLTEISKTWGRDPIDARMRTLASLHADFKKTIDKFDLDRGFEFASVVSTGERQCYLQSVILASMAQRFGADAMVAMVNRNEKGEYSNNGHAVPLIKVAQDRWVVLDASEPHPFAEHQGYFLFQPKSACYIYVTPSYDPYRCLIALRSQGTGAKVPFSSVGPMPADFLRSQFDFYRGEHTPNGLVAKKPTKEGLLTSRKWLVRSVAECPQNPLAVFSLGRVEKLLKDGRFTATMAKAKDLYKQYGWLPDSLKS